MLCLKLFRNKKIIIQINETEKIELELSPHQPSVKIGITAPKKFSIFREQNVNKNTNSQQSNQTD